MEPREFIRTIAPGAQALQRKYGIFSSVTIAQAALETGWGKFLPIDMNTGQISNNLFGIKGEGPAGSVRSKTWEVIDGAKVEVTSDFRAYRSYEESLDDHHQFLQQERYAPVTEADTPEEAARRLYKCGYATDPEYPDKLISIIAQYGLKRYDDSSITAGPFPDVPFDHWAAEAVAYVKNAGLMTGDDEGLFRGDKPLTRYEAAVLVKRLMERG